MDNTFVIRIDVMDNDEEEREVTVVFQREQSLSDPYQPKVIESRLSGATDLPAAEWEHVLECCRTVLKITALGMRIEEVPTGVRPVFDTIGTAR